MMQFEYSARLPSRSAHCPIVSRYCEYNKITLLQVPTIFWLVKPTEDNLWWVAAAGSSISLLVAWRGAANCWLMLVLWGLYHSLVNIGQTWYSYGKPEFSGCEEMVRGKLCLLGRRDRIT